MDPNAGGPTADESATSAKSGESTEAKAGTVQQAVIGDPCSNDNDCGECEECTGMAPNQTCTARSAGSSCGSNNDTTCDNPDTCDGAGACLENFEPSTTTCGSSTDDDCRNPDTCDGAGSCVSNDLPAGSACGDPTDNDCTDPDTCEADGDCADNDESSGTACGDQRDDDCREPDTCDGNGVCQGNDDAPGTPCGSSSNTTCTDPDRCDANGDCQPNHAPNGTSCGDGSSDECDAADSCLNGSCVDNNLAAGTACGDQTDTECDNPNTCDGSGSCSNNYATLGIACGDQTTTACSLPDTCNGSGACQQNHQSAGVSCGDSTNNECTDPDTCDGSGTCQPNHESSGSPCGSQTNDDCTDPDTCNGSGSCLANHALEFTACGSQSDSECSNPNSCNATGQCLARDEPSGTPCGNQSNTPCDAADTCNGSGSCQSNQVAAGTPCDDGISCTNISECNGTGLCLRPGDLTTQELAADNDNCPNDTDPLAACANWSCNPVACPGNGDCDPAVGCVPSFLPSSSVCRVIAGECDVAENCTGSDPTCPTDGFQASNFVCQMASCTAGVAKVQTTCATHVAGVCQPLADVDCSPYQCDEAGVACRTTCEGSSDCQPEYYCTGGVCQPRIDPGQSCTTNAQCSPSNPYCVDGVCCDLPCEGQCEACNVPGSAGSCAPVTGEPVGDREPCAADGTACDGACDGVTRNECSYPGGQVECQPASCDPLTNLAVEAAFCDGNGACDTDEPVDCAPYACGPVQCRGDCTADSDCDDTAYCRAGMCAPKLPEGDPCSRAAQCDSGFCTDGVCCDTRCEGQCEACNAAGSEGSCSAVSGVPVGDRPACAGSGQCAGVCDGTDRATCAYPGRDTECQAAACNDGVATLAAACNGSGACPSPRTVECPTGCEGSLCAGDECVLDSDCPAGESCSAGVCLPQQPPGASCGDDADCASGFCVDGVCCDSACLGQCEACDVVGSEGTCSPVPAGEAPRGGRSACTSDGSACGGTCDGSNRTGCEYPVGTVCREGSCEDDGSGAVAVVEATCQGDGRCPAEQQQACGQYDCTASGGLCDGDCATDPSDCEEAEYCSAGVCVAKRPDGSSCAGAEQCQSGYCIDGVCCATECDAQCEACDVPGSVGTCRPVTGAPHGGRESCAGQGPCGAECNGTSREACAFPSEGQSCGAAYCSSGVQSSGPTCSGDGRCTEGETEACLSLSCDGASCGTGCTTDADCTGENYCLDGVCTENDLIDALDEGTCGCRLPGAGRAGEGWLLLALASAGVAALRRRRRAAGGLTLR